MRAEPDSGTAWTTAQVVRMTGLTSRTLRHYDRLNLVVPMAKTTGGMRVYGRPELLRLQEVLLLRELGLSLSTIRSVVDGRTDRAQALREHQARLLIERDRLARLAETVQRTIEDLEGGRPMSEEALFEGFDPERQKAYERELVEDWGVSQQALDRSRAAVKTLGKEGIAALEAERARIEAALLDLMAGGVAPDDRQVMDTLRGHWELTGRYWDADPSAEAYAGLGDMYVQHPDFKARYDAMAPGMAQWMSDAMTAYALARLT